MRLSQWNRTRLKVTLLGDIFCMAAGILAIIYKMEGAAVTAITGVLTITSMYSFSEGKRPSKNCEDGTN